MAEHDNSTQAQPDAKGVSGGGGGGAPNLPLVPIHQLPGTAYSLFMQEEKNKAAQEGKAIGASELSVRWKAMTNPDRRPFMERAATATAEFTARYKMTPGDYKRFYYSTTSYTPASPAAATAAAAAKRKAGEMSSFVAGGSGAGHVAANQMTLGDLMRRNRETDNHGRYLEYLVKRFRLDQEYFRGSTVHVSSKTIDPHQTCISGPRHDRVVKLLAEFARLQGLTMRTDKVQYPDEQDVEVYVFDLAPPGGGGGAPAAPASTGTAPMDTSVDTSAAAAPVPTKVPETTKETKETKEPKPEAKSDGRSSTGEPHSKRARTEPTSSRGSSRSSGSKEHASSSSSSKSKDKDDDSDDAADSSSSRSKKSSSSSSKQSDSEADDE